MISSLWVRRGVFTAIVGAAVAVAASSGEPDRERAYRENNLGVAELEQYNYERAGQAFSRALAIEPTLALARINLGIALYYKRDMAGAAEAARIAAEAAPSAPQPPYLLGLIARAENRPDEAATYFQRVLSLDADDLGARVNLGQVYLQQQRFAEAVTLFRAAFESEPFNVTAAYNLGVALNRSGQPEEGQRVLAEFQKLRESGYSTAFSNTYLEQGRYAEAVTSTGAESDLVNRAVPDVSFTPDALAEAPDAGSRLEASRLALADLDRDGDFDLVEASAGGMRVFENVQGKMREVTAARGFGSLSGRPAIGAVAGDVDNDEKTDLLVLFSEGMRFFRQDAAGRFADASSSPGFAPSFRAAAAALADVDHDGDLDIVAAGEAGLLLRNNGNLTFTDTSRQAGLTEATGTLVASDFDNRRDIDLLSAGRGAVRLFRNQRDGTFRDAAGDVGLTGVAQLTAVSIGDVNKDDFPDLFLGREGNDGVLALSNGRGRFVAGPAPGGTRDVVAAQFADYDNDGLLDLVTLAPTGLAIWRNLGDAWSDVSSRAIPAPWRAGQPASDSPRLIAMAIGDVDADGDHDLVVQDATGRVWLGRNDASARLPALVARLTGRVANRDGVGTKVDLRAGSLRQRLETSATTPAVTPAGVLFGLGGRKPDVVRMLWPSGIVQAEAVAGPEGGPALLSVTELDRKPSSCPFLYTWNGTRFEFITDFLGGGEMGYRQPTGTWSVPDPDEVVRIRGDQLVPKHDRLELRVTNELEEALYLDSMELLAVTHPSGTEVYPNEGLRSSRAPAMLYLVSAPRPPARAVSDDGHDVLDRLARLDAVYVDDFGLERVRGYAREHALTLDLGDTSATDREGRLLLVLTGWTDYAFSSDNVAAAQAQLALRPPSLQVRDATGAWQTAISEIGLPVGRPQSVVVDLTGKFPTANREVRIVTTMRVYWDQAFVDASGKARALDLASLPSQSAGGLEPAGDTGLSIERLPRLEATLRWRGYSAPVTRTSPGFETYDYEGVSFTAPWKVMPGRYTREGDVGELLGEADDLFVVARTGDEIALSFRVGGAPGFAGSTTRTYLLVAQGYSKEMDINSASPDQVEPLPFGAMSGYPYAPPEAYPSSQRHRDYLERYNTRVVTRPIPPVERSLGRPAGR